MDEFNLSQHARVPEDMRLKTEAFEFSKKIYPLISDGNTYAVTITRKNNEQGDRVLTRFNVSIARRQDLKIRWIKLSWRARLRILIKGGYETYE